MPEKIVVIHNPLARGGKTTKLQPPPAGTGADVSILETTTPEQATALAREAVRNGVRKIVAAGGDGTLNAVANGIEGCKDVLLGILPVGTMNVFAREIGLPLDLKACWEIILKKNTRRVDTGLANGRIFLSNAGVGLDAQVVAETNSEWRKQIGPLSYVLKGLEIAGRPAPTLHVLSDSGNYYSGTFVIIGNGRLYGGPFEIFTGGSIDDGLLNVILFQRISHWDVLRYLHCLFLGNGREFADMVRLRTSRLSVRSATTVPYEVDGELAGQTPVEFEVKRCSLEVLCQS